MKYEKKIVMEFADLARSDDRDLEELWNEFINSDPDSKKYPIEDVVRLVCESYGVKEHEFYLKMKFGNLPEVRKVVVYILLKIGYKSVEIEDFFGWTQPRVSNLKRQANEAYRTSNVFHLITEKVYETISG